MKKIKYGIIGCGKHALYSHAMPSKKMKNFELTIVCDTSLESMNNFEKIYGKKLMKTSDRKEFFSSDIKAVFVGTPDEFHYKDLIDSINARKHVLVEKPLATKVNELEGLKRALLDAKNKGIIVTSCHPRRYDPPFLWLKKNIPIFKKEYGEVISFIFDFSYHQTSRAWKHSRGLLLDHGNHEVDLMNYLLEVSGFKAFKLRDEHDIYKVVGRRNDGIDFSFSGTRRLKSKVYREKAIIRFERGEILLESDLGRAILRDHETGKLKDIKVEKTDYEERGRKTMANFARSILGKEKVYLSSQDLYVNTAFSVVLTDKEEWNYNDRSN